MRCPELRKHLSAHLDGAVDEACARAITTHLANCEACATLAAQSKRLDELLSTLPQPEPSAGFDDGFRAKLRAARDEQARASQRPRRRGWFGLPLFLGAGATAAAAVVLAVVLLGRSPKLDEPAVSETALAQNLGLLRNYKVVQHLDALEDFEAIEDLDRLLGAAR